MEFEYWLHPRGNTHLKRTSMKPLFLLNDHSIFTRLGLFSGISKRIVLKAQALRLIMILILITGNLMLATATAGRVEGFVVDESGTALPGVSVIVKGTAAGVVTNSLGRYEVSIRATDTHLVFMCIGMKQQTIAIQGRSRIDVVMVSDVMVQEEEALAGIRMRGVASQKSMAQASSVMHFECAPSVMVAYDVDYNTENYATIHENGFKEVFKDPLSTFSVDVDRASYSNVRRFLNNGQLPPADAVRIEEMINYFSYDYQAPTDDHPFAVHQEMAVAPWNKDHFLMKVGLKGLEIEKENLPPSNLVFLLDVSGSMNAANKLPLLKSAFHLLVESLRPNDRVSIVVYAGASGCVLEPTPGNQKQKILEALNRLEAGGSTAGAAGLNLAYEKAEAGLIKGGNNRIILATDGDFNVGVSSNAEMERMVTEKKEKGIFITVLGFGMGNYKDDRLEVIANKGNGNYAYIDNLQEAQKTLVSEFGGTLFTIAKDVKFQIEFNPAKVLAYRLVGYENRLLNAEDFNNDKKDAGEIGAGHTVTALYEIIPVGARDAGNWIGQIDPLRYQKSAVWPSVYESDEWVTLKLRYKEPDGDKSRLMVIPVKGQVKPFQNASDDFRFVAAVAGFGMLLRNSEFKGSLTYAEVQEMARNARGRDQDGFKAEMARLIQTAEGLSRSMVNSRDSQ
jgi:Ca-activated chloride channel homolog